ncbi:hypothetical protein CRG98_043499 [Punica granatum]|uniref:Uncharacterized protein n=1 Tax=Punica granatum TaxID=22663 RepID=A0A2I0HWM6_PUNGR|nr:hypothetical protein CRG98_043499 [Punica granatum]
MAINSYHLSVSSVFIYFVYFVMVQARIHRTRFTRGPIPQPSITGSNVPHILNARNPSAEWDLASNHRFDPSSIKAEDDLGPNGRNEVRQSLGRLTPTVISRTIRSSKIRRFDRTQLRISRARVALISVSVFPTLW